MALARARPQPPIPYGGEVRIVVLTAPERPTFLVSRPNEGAPRAEFVDECAKRLFGKQPNGQKHEWEIVEPVAAAAATALPIGVE